MTDDSIPSEASGGQWMHRVRKVIQTVCLVAMVGGLVTLGALGYQGWRVTHNPFRSPKRIVQAPSPEVAAWAAEVYRQEKRQHLFLTGFFEVAMVVLSAGAWVVYRKVDQHLQGLHRLKHPLPERVRRHAGPPESTKG